MYVVTMVTCCSQDAYNAVQANPVAHSALGNLQRLVNTLINTSNIATLCSLPYAADYTVKHSDGRQAPDSTPSMKLLTCHSTNPPLLLFPVLWHVGTITTGSRPCLQCFEEL